VRFIDLQFKPYCVKGPKELKNKLAFDMINGNTVTTPGFYAPQGRSVRINLKYPHRIEDLLYFNFE